MGTSEIATLNNINGCDDEGTHTHLYYGVYTPNENTNGVGNVFEDKLEALKLARKNKKSRFKAFRFYHEAVEFSLNGSECPNNNMVDGSLLEKKTAETAQPLGEKASPFKGPKPQELVELRKAIEAGNINLVRETIWQNPRYLVSSGDTPSILQEGSRYNALHVAAKAKNAAITELILNTISDPEFVKLLYGDDNQENAEERCRMLLDLYLNTPNKGLNETPLHFASKYGAADVVEILVSYPQCNKFKRNKHYRTADMIICERVEGHNAKIASIEKKIEVLLEDNYYVPVLRTEDNSLPPAIGQPFSPTSPPVLNKDILSPRLEIHAYAGPMDKKGAEQFRKVWKTPPRSLNRNSPNGTKSSDDLVNMTSLRFKDPQKGLERIGNKLARKFDVQWREYWPFLDSFIDIVSEEGLNMLEGYLSNRYADLNESLKNSPIIDKTDIVSPISNLCAAFSACHLNESSILHEDFDERSDFDPLLCVEKACQVFANRISNSILYVLCNDQDSILKTLENEIKQLELLINSYMDDYRFLKINFQKIHSRLGLLTGLKLYNYIREEADARFLCDKIEKVLENITKSLDCFSSDDEGHNMKDRVEQKKPTAYRKQLICLIHNVLNVLAHKFDNNRECVEDERVIDCWENAEACSCIYHIRRTKRNNLSRSSSFKNNSKIFSSLKMENISKRLCFDDNDDSINNVMYELAANNDINLSMSMLNQMDYSSEEEDGVFLTPPSTPSLLIDDSDSEDEFDDAELPSQDVFLEGDIPTKTDSAVFNALRSSEYSLDKEKHPSVYRWHHNVGLYSETERERWPSPRNINTRSSLLSPNVNGSSASFPNNTSTPSKSWLRITGANSPRAVLKSRSSVNR